MFDVMDRSYGDDVLKNLCFLLSYFAGAQACAEANEDSDKVHLYERKIDNVKQCIISVVNEY